MITKVPVTVRVTELLTVRGPVADALVEAAIVVLDARAALLTRKISVKPEVVSPVAAPDPRKYPAPPPIEPQDGEEPA